MVLPCQLLATVAGVLALPPIAIHAPGVDCPTAAAVDHSLSLLVARPVNDPPATAWTLSIEPSAAGPSAANLGIRIVLRSSTGEIALTRILTGQILGGRCDSAAVAIALILERYFRNLDWTADTAAPAVRTMPASHKRVASAVDTAPPAPGPHPPGLQLSTGLAAWNRGAQPFVAHVELRARVVGRLSVAVGALLPPSSQADTVLTSDRVHLQMWPFLARVVANGATGLVSWWGGLDGLIVFERADPAPALANPDTKRRVTFAPGAVAGAEVRLSARWRLGFEIAGYRTVLGNSLLVGTGDRTTAPAIRVLEPPAWQRLAALRLGWLILP